MINSILIFSFQLMQHAYFYLYTGRARSRIGKRAIIPTRVGDNSNVTLIAAISPVYGLIYHELHLGGTDGDRFSTFIENLLRHEFCVSRSRVLIMDNASIHHVEQVENVVNASPTRHRIEYLPPYSPHLNPIEYMFKKVKQYLHPYLKSTNEHLMTLIERGLRTVTINDCAGWNRECTRCYFKCIDLEPLE
jgi:transposase